jgi:hypothetical protein
MLLATKMVKTLSRSRLWRKATPNKTRKSSDSPRLLLKNRQLLTQMRKSRKLLHLEKIPHQLQIWFCPAFLFTKTMRL